MLSYIVRRVAHAILVVIGITVVVFLLQQAVASGPALAHAMLGPRASALSIKAFVDQYGLNQSLVDQYWKFLWQLLHGNLGYSYKLHRSVDSIIARDLPHDFLLVGLGVFIAIAMAIPIGMAQATRRGTLLDHGVTAISFVLYSMPSFWLGLIFIEFLAINTSIFPAEAPQGTSIGDPRAMVLPIATIALVSYALFSRYMRSSAIDTLAADFIRTARAKGASNMRVLLRHTLRNSLAAVVTLVGLSLPALFTWGTAIEYVFNYPGTGLSFYNAATADTYPIELGIIVLIGVAVVLGNLAADIGYAVLDPRIQYD